MKRMWSLLLMVPVCFFMAACGDDDDDKIDPGTLDAGPTTEVDKDTGVKTANWPYDTLQVKVGPTADPIAVKLNGTPVEDLIGHDKNGNDISAEAIPFSVILDKAGVDAATYDGKVINCVARDNFDPLRTKLSCDPTQAPTVGDFRKYAFVYNCTGKNEDGTPLDGKALCVNYKFASESEIPANMGKAYSDLGKHQWSKIETVDDESLGVKDSGHGVIEIDPDLENDPKCQQPTK